MRFIGGPAHGRFIAVQHNHKVVNIPVSTTKPLWEPEIPDKPVTVEVVTYHRQMIEVGNIERGWMFREMVMAPIDQHPNETERLLLQMLPPWATP